jgi:hypothetical protein
MGIDGFIKLGSRYAKISTVDMESFEFEISKLQLENTVAYYVQTMPFEETEEDTVSSLMGTIILDELIIKSVLLDYLSEPDQMTASLSLGEFTAELPEANLQEQLVRLESFVLRDSKTLFYNFSVPDSATVPNDTESAPFTRPAWDVKAVEITIANTDIDYKSAYVSVKKGFYPLKNIPKLTH